MYLRPGRRLPDPLAYILSTTLPPFDHPPNARSERRVVTPGLSVTLYLTLQLLLHTHGTWMGPGIEWGEGLKDQGRR